MSSVTSSYRSSSRYSTSSTYRSKGSLSGSTDSLDVLLEPFLDSSNCSSLFGDDSSLTPFSRHRSSSCEHGAPAGGAVTGLQTGACSGVRCVGDTYYISADVSQFEPQDIVVMAYNQSVVIQAQKVLEDGSVSDTFSHKSQLPKDMDPLSVSGTLQPDGTLLVSTRRTTGLTGLEPPDVLTHCSHAQL
ncbi:Heat shock protein beta-7 [Oryzias melastigma]|uniref:Heat shock protein beta-7 n=1 Tax=Oryzias melastigma TaxID=30732 RepID=A0A3B3CJM3_ORYME|nr:heat shock protein beta-7 [Oryzias melastigma]KAF6736081.1 Heat shock protein beta-7 [Oryzias melastigma]